MGRGRYLANDSARYGMGSGTPLACGACGRRHGMLREPWCRVSWLPISREVIRFCSLCMPAIFLLLHMRNFSIVQCLVFVYLYKYIIPGISIVVVRSAHLRISFPVPWARRVGGHI